MDERVEDYNTWQANLKASAALAKEEAAKKQQELSNKRTDEAILQGLLDKANEMMSHMTPDKMEESSLKELASSFGIIYDRLRLARGQSTANLNLNNLSGMIASVSSRSVDEKFVDAEVVDVELKVTGEKHATQDD